jgi:uncharacterized phiE125 gp8 family phage protein
VPLGVRIVTGPTVLPVSLDAAKRRLRVDTSDEDDDIAALLRECVSIVEGETGRQLAESTIEAVFPRFPCNGEPLRLPRPPLRSVVSLTYFDPAGVQQTLLNTAYWVASSFEPGQLVPASGSWPDTHSTRPEAVVVRYTAGYLPTTLPPVAAAVILDLVAHRWKHRGDATIPPQTRRSLDQLWDGEVR